MTARLFNKLVRAGLIWVCLAGGAAAQQTPPPNLVVPPGEALRVMIVNTLIAYNQGNLTGNYSVLRDLASPQFRETNSPARLADVFRDMREDAINIAPIVIFQPKLIREPEIDEDGDLILEGFFDTRPERVQYFLVYRAVQNRWKLFAISVKTSLAEESGVAVTTGDGSSQSGATTGDTSLGMKDLEEALIKAIDKRR